MVNRYWEINKIGQSSLCPLWLKLLTTEDTEEDKNQIPNCFRNLNSSRFISP